MDDRVASYLCKFTITPHINNVINTKAVIIIETRRIHTLTQSLSMMLQVLGPGYNLYIFHGELNEFQLKLEMKDWKVRFMNLPVIELSTHLLDHLLTRKAFWLNFQEKQLVFVRHDTVFLRPLPDHVWNYAFVAPPNAHGQPSASLFTCLTHYALNVLERARPSTLNDLFACLMELYPEVTPTFIYANQVLADSFSVSGDVSAVTGHFCHTHPTSNMIMAQIK